MLDVEIKTIPHGTQRYETVGDYFEQDGKDMFRVSDCGNRKYEWMLAIHEMIEKALCESVGVTNEAIDDFDIENEDDPEPGDRADAPYRDQHCFATAVERMLCAALGLSWADYEKALGELK